MKKLSQILTLGLQLAAEERVSYRPNYGSDSGMCVITSRMLSKEIISYEEAEFTYAYLNKMMKSLRKKNGISFVYLREYLRSHLGVPKQEIETAWANHYQAVIENLNQEGK